VGRGELVPRDAVSLGDGEGGTTSPVFFLFPCCESPPAVSGRCCGCWAGAWPHPKVKAPCHTGAWGRNAAVVPPHLAVPPRLVMYEHEGFAVARSSSNPHPPPSWGPSCAVRSQRELRDLGAVLPTSVGTMPLGASGCALGCDFLVAQRLAPGTTPSPLT